MAIDIGDAVLTFLGDTTQLDQTFDKVGTEVPAKMAPVEAAFKGTSDAVTEMTGQMAVGQNGAKQLGEVMNLAGETSRESMYEARGEAELLGEMIGVRLPRHVRSFISELPGVGVALSAAFQATAILFIIDALAKVAEKIIEFAHHADKVGEAWDGVKESEQRALEHLSDDLIKAQIETDKLTGDHLGALLLELELIDRTTLSNLRNEFIKLEKEADKAFETMDANMFESLLGGFEGSGEAKGVFDKMAKSVTEALDTGKPEAFLKALNAINDAADTADKRLKTATLPADQLEAWAEINKRADAYRDLLEKTAALDWQEKLNDALKLLTEQESDLEKQAKRTMEARIEQIKATENAEHEAFNNGKISADQWAQAQIKSTDEIAKAHIDYANSIAAATLKQKEISDQLKDGTLNAQKWVEEQKQSVEVSKSAAAAQDAQTEKLKEWNAIAKQAEDGISKAQAETAKLRAEMEKLVFPVEKAKDQTQALKELANAEKQLAEAQKALALAQSTQDFKEQEAAIKQLAQLRIISKEQEAAQLARIARNEEDAQLAVLKEQLANEEKELLAAKAKFTSGQLDPLTSPEELTRLQTALAQKQAAFDKTETQILNRSTATSDKMIANDRSYYGRSLALLLAFGNTQDAARLKSLNTQIAENKVKLQAAQADLIAARAKGQETKAIQDQITQLQRLIIAEQREEKQIEQTAHKGLSAWKQFSSGFRDQAEQNVKSMQQMSVEMEQDVQSFGSVISGAFESMVTSQESFGQAMLHGTEKLIGQMAEQWGEFFLAKGIADIFFDPPLGGAELAAGAALMAIGGALSGLGSGSSSAPSASASKGTPVPAAGSPAATAGGIPGSTLNVPRLSGGLVTQPTVAVVAGSSSGGTAMRQIAAALASHGSSGGDIHIHIETDLLSSARMISQNVKSGRVRLTSSNSLSPRGRRS